MCESHRALEGKVAVPNGYHRSGSSAAPVAGAPDGAANTRPKPIAKLAKEKQIFATKAAEP